MQARLTKFVPVKNGQLITVTLVYLIYVSDQLALPAGGVARGSLVSLNADSLRRNDVRLNADFTRYHTPVVRLNEVELPSTIDVVSTMSLD